jgi:hypothetical protein
MNGRFFCKFKVSIVSRLGNQTEPGLIDSRKESISSHVQR